MKASIFLKTSGRLAVAACLVSVATMAFAQEATDLIAPEPQIGLRPTESAPPAHARSHMIAAAHPLAAAAGLKILEAGGSAADALVAVQATLGLVEPLSSGLGGGGFLVWHDGETGEILPIDGRETAPAAAKPELFLDESGKPLEFFDAVVGGRSVGVPGIVRLLQVIHERSGRLPWERLFDDAIELAENGFEVSPRLAGMIEAYRDRLLAETGTRMYFFDASGQPHPAGQVLRNHDYAETLRSLAQGGPDEFYTGAAADAIFDAVTLHAANPGQLTTSDLASYRAVLREAVCVPYREHEVCGMGPPSSGAIAIGQILGMVEPFDLAALGPDDPVSWRIIGDATRLAFADRGKFVADPDFVRMPKGLLQRQYLAARSQLLRRDTALAPEEVAAGDPPWDRAELRLEGISFERDSTSHFVVVDRMGNVASLTTSIENAFGSMQMAAGFLLNNQLTDFSFLPREQGELVANRVEPGKRPRSSMSPTIIRRDGKPVYALGSPGGSNIIPYVARTIIALIDWQMDPQQAVSLPHLTNRFGRYDLEKGTAAEELADDLAALGYEVAPVELNSGLHVVSISADGLTGGADPRREGVAIGD